MMSKKRRQKMRRALTTQAESIKRCSRCREVKPLSSFHRREASVDGRQAYCISCREEYYRENRIGVPQRRNQSSDRIDGYFHFCEHDVAWSERAMAVCSPKRSHELVLSTTPMTGTYVEFGGLVL